ncbi:MAG: type II secretion system F family protein [Gemmatimonadota bacterium]|nr:MAG: type II secretion system F family protein [Gemmatimonadota bacterium]
MLLPTLLVVFVASFGLVLGTYVFVGRHTLARRTAARRRIHDVQGADVTAGLLRDDSISEIPLLNRWLQKSAHAVSLQHNIRAAGLNTRPATVMLTAGALATAGLLAGSIQNSLLFGLGYAIVGAFLPFLYIRRKQRKRIADFESQLPDALDLLNNAMRAGYSYQAAMELIGQELPDPLGAEFAQFYEEQRLGRDVRAALLAMLDRVESMDLKMFTTAVLIQRETGGNLSEVLGNISHVIRERFRIQGELRMLTAQVNLSSKILAVLPAIVVGGIALINPGFMEPLLKERVGNIMLAIAATSQVLGFLVMRKLARIEI